MRKILFSITLLILLVSLVSADIIITQQPTGIYNLGESISIPITIKSTGDAFGSFEMNLICNGHDINFYKNGVGLIGGEEKEMSPSLILTKNMIGDIVGNCKIKGTFMENYVLTEVFKISNLIKISATIEEREFNPGENILITGDAVKENGEDAEGFVELMLVTDNSSEISQLETIQNGFFSINLTLAENMKAGSYLVKLTAYERNSEEITTNKGFVNYNIVIAQIPTSLEISSEEQEVEPGTNLKVKTILHDQTGEKINSNSIITIKNEDDEILEQIEIATEEFLEYPIKYNQAPAEWTIMADSNELTTESTFSIKEKMDVKVELINKTAILTNVGNVPYQDILLIKIGNSSVNINASLKVDETQKYILSAPNGNYQVEIIADGETEINQNVALTGRAIDVKKAGGTIITLVKYPFVWVFIIAILGIMAFIVFKKGYKKNFMGYMSNFKRKTKNDLTIPMKKNALVTAKNNAELSLSIKGDKQNISLICLNLKNYKDLESKKGNASEILQKLVKIAEEEKAVLYENQNNLFFLIAPIKTKTFHNEKTALDIAQKIKEELEEHNKLAKQKIDFGISLNYGTIIAKQEPTVLKFMSMGTLITTAKKIAIGSQGEILLSEKINDKMKTDIKTEKKEINKTPVYILKEIKNKQGNEKFIKNFLKRIEGKN